VRALPPFELGAVQVNEAEAFPATAFTFVGAPGTVTCRAASTPGVPSMAALVPVGDDAPAYDDTAKGTIVNTRRAAAPKVLNFETLGSNSRVTLPLESVRLIRTLNDIVPSAFVLSDHSPRSRAGNDARQSCRRRP
jgi:hypothetical protein